MCATARRKAFITPRLEGWGRGGGGTSSEYVLPAEPMGNNKLSYASELPVAITSLLVVLGSRVG